jgi:HAD superfamily hydrolase (TIGR01509 family)
MTVDELNAKVAQLLKLPDFDWRVYYFAELEATPGMAEFVSWVRGHYGVGLLTNSMPGLVPQMVHSQLLPQVSYDAVVDSSEVHHIKPEREIYELAQAQSASAPHEILFTDDSRANLMAAEKLGWHVMLFDDSRPAESIARLKAALELA